MFNKYTCCIVRQLKRQNQIQIAKTDHQLLNLNYEKLHLNIYNYKTQFQHVKLYYLFIVLAKHTNFISKVITKKYRNILNNNKNISFKTNWKYIKKIFLVYNSAKNFSSFDERNNRKKIFK